MDSLSNAVRPLITFSAYHSLVYKRTHSGVLATGKKGAVKRSNSIGSATSQSFIFGRNGATVLLVATVKEVETANAS